LELTSVFPRHVSNGLVINPDLFPDLAVGLALLGQFTRAGNAIHGR
jgi:hypothetical protein